MSQIVRHGVDRKTVLVFFIVMGVAIVLVSIEQLGLWPETWRAQPISRHTPPPAPPP